jgi:hypothetical protein
MTRRSARSDDSGSVLLFAVIVVFVVMVVVTSMLSLVSGNLTSTSAYGDAAGSAAVAEGAVQTAANTIRQTLFNNGPADSCFPNASDTLHLDDLAVQGGQHYSATVTCTPSGGPPSPVDITSNNRLDLAIVTRGSLAGEDGVFIKAPTAHPLRIHGGVYSNSNINIVSGSLLDDQGVFARGACTGAGSITPAPICHNAGGTPSGADKTYPQPAGAVPAYQGSAQVGAAGTPLPLSGVSYPNSCRGSVITFSPGYYDSAAALSKMMSSSGCAGSTFWFKTGLYYFDFHDGDDPALPPATHAWSVRTGALIGGTPVDSAGHALARPPLSPTVPGACMSPLMSSAARGVQFVFGGDSRLVVDGATAELCGTYSTTSPPIAVYGATSGTETQSAPSGLHMTPDTGSGGFTDPNNMLSRDGRTATWTKTSTGSETRSETVTGFLPTSNVPIPGTHLDAATLTVVHGNTASEGADDRKVGLLLPDGTTISLPMPARSGNAMHSDVIDIPLDSGLADYIHSTGLAQPLSITYSATVDHPGVESVDAISLDLTYRLPAYRSQDSDVTGGNCLKSAYTGGAGSGCAGITSTLTSGTHLNIQGAVYEPRAAVDIRVDQPATPVLTFGVVARSLRLEVTGSSAFDQPVIHSPDVVARSNIATNVILSAYVCPTTSGCAASGTAALRARIAIIDPVVPGAVVPFVGRRALTVQSWSSPLRSGG